MIAIGIFLSFVIVMFILGLKCTPIIRTDCEMGIHRWRESYSKRDGEGYKCKKCGRFSLYGNERFGTGGGSGLVG